MIELSKTKYEIKYGIVGSIQVSSNALEDIELKFQYNKFEYDKALIHFDYWKSKKNTGNLLLYRIFIKDKKIISEEHIDHKV